MPSTSLRAAYAAAIAFTLLVRTSSAGSYGAMTYIGCFSSSSPLKDQGEYTWQSSGYCQGVCGDDNEAAFGLSDGSHCWCGDSYPAKADMVDDSNCSTNCTGYPQDKCGGDDYWSVYKTGTTDEVSYADSSSSSSTGSSSTAKSTTSHSSSSSTTAGSSTTSTDSSSTTNGAVVVTSATSPGKTVIITLSPSSTESAKKSGGSNTAGIAAGVVVGVVAIAAIAGAVFFFLRQKKRRAIEEEYSKRSQAQDYGASGAAGGMAGARGVSLRNSNDARLDPEAMLHRRLSDGSIADEQDYSRRILKVTNPDDGR